MVQISIMWQWRTQALLIPDTNLTLYNLYSNVRLRWELWQKKLKVKELGPDQPDGLIYCEELVVKLFAVPVCHSPTSKNIHQPPLEHTHTAVNTHTQQWTHTQSSGQPFMLRRSGSSWGFGALLKGLTSVVVLRVKRALDVHRQFLLDQDSISQSLDYESDSLTIRPRLPLLTVGGSNVTKILYTYYSYLK